MTTHAPATTSFKSPTGYPLCGWRGLRGPTYRQLHTYDRAICTQIPHSRRVFALPSPAPGEGEGEG